VSEQTLGEQYDDIMNRLDEAYAARRACAFGTPEYADAHAALELVFVDLRALNDLAWQSTGGRPSPQARRTGLGR
jgi:hypothetical protein